MPNPDRVNGRIQRADEIRPGGSCLLRVPSHRVSWVAPLGFNSDPSVSPLGRARPRCAAGGGSLPSGHPPRLSSACRCGKSRDQKRSWWREVGLAGWGWGDDGLVNGLLELAADWVGG